MASGSSDDITVTSNISWDVSDNAGWLSVSPGSGSGNGTFTVTVVVRDDDGGSHPDSFQVTVILNQPPVIEDQVFDVPEAPDPDRVRREALRRLADRDRLE